MLTGLLLWITASGQKCIMKLKKRPISQKDIENEYKEFLRTDEQNCFSWEKDFCDNMRIQTALGAGRGRFWHMYKHLRKSIWPGCRVIDFGPYPGTLLRLLRKIAGRDIELTAAGFEYSEGFRTVLSELDITLLEMEFDCRKPSTKFHGLNYPLEKSNISSFDIAICSEVIEHLMYPMFLLNIINRFTKKDGIVYLTTNNACFISDILKLLVGRHNVQNIQLSHVLNDSLWRPHIRLFTLSELSLLFKLAGFRVEQAYYFDNYEKGRIHKGLRGIGKTVIRKIASLIPHLRSHIFVIARKVSPPTVESLDIIKRTLCIYGLQDNIHLGRYSA